MGIEINGQFDISEEDKEINEEAIKWLSRGGNMGDFLINALYERKREYGKWAEEIPYIKFPKNYEVKIMPPFNNAIVRFLVKCNNASVSVYLDCYDKLGSVGKPYWEIYPYENDTFRCLLKETDLLLEAIEKSLNKQEEECIS